MKLTESQRTQRFLKARSIDAFLGDLFQNEMDITAEDITHELDKLAAHEKLIKDTIKSYRSNLTDILAAMGQGKDTLE